MLVDERLVTLFIFEAWSLSRSVEVLLMGMLNDQKDEALERNRWDMEGELALLMAIKPLITRVADKSLVFHERLSEKKAMDSRSRKSYSKWL